MVKMKPLPYNSDVILHKINIKKLCIITIFIYNISKTIDILLERLYIMNIKS